MSQTRRQAAAKIRSLQKRVALAPKGSKKQREAELSAHMHAALRRLVGGKRGRR